MTKKIQSLFLFIAFLTAIFFTCVFSSLFVRADSSDFEKQGINLVFSEELASSYDLGETLTFPTAKVVYNGKDYTANLTVELPSGKTKAEKQIVLDQAGTYKATYIAYIDPLNKYIKEIKSFIVCKDLFSVIGTGSVAYSKFELGDQKTEGALAKLYNGDVLTYNNVIDLTRFDLRQPFMKFFVIPQVLGQADFTRITVTLTDIYDSGKFIIFRVKKSDLPGHEHIYTYSDSSFDNINYYGWEVKESGSGCHKNDEYGLPIQFSYTGYPNRTTLGGEYMGASFDFYNNALYLGNQIEQLLCFDFDDTTNALLTGSFGGFTDGKVKVSVKAEGLLASYAQIMFPEFNGVKITEESYKLKDDENPTIIVDLQGYSEENVPNAMVGKAYPIYDAKAFDLVDGAIEVKTSVFYNYNSVNKVKVNIQNNTFTPNNEGLYTIEYTSTDASGNTAIKTITITVANKGAALTATFNGLVQECYIGEEIVVIEGFDAVNNYGNVNVDIRLILKSDSSVVYITDITKGYKVTPLYSGTYDVIFTISDFVEEIVINKTLTVKTANTAKYEVNGVFPNYLIHGANYQLPNVTALDLSSGKPVSKKMSLSVSEDGAAAQSKDLLYTVGANETVELIYSFEGGSGREYRKEIPVRKVGLESGKIEMPQYFIVENGSATFDVNMSGMAIITSASDTVVAFANALASDSFTTSFVPYGILDWSEFSILLYDYANQNNFIKLTFYNESGVLFAVNDGDKIKVADSFVGDKVSLAVDFEYAKNLVIINETYSVPVNAYYNGGEFNGFSDGAVFKLAYNGATNGSGVRLQSLNGQFISSLKLDAVGPRIISPAEQCGGEYSINSTVTILPYQAFDVLSPYVKLELLAYVVETGEVAKAKDGTTLDMVDARKSYELYLEIYGSYIVNVVATDLSGNEETYSLFISCVDFNKPKITLKSVTTSVKVGEKITLDATKYIVDKEGCDVFYTVKDENGVIHYFGDDGFVAKTAGKYVVTVGAIDEYGNFGYVSYTVTVK